MATKRAGSGRPAKRASARSRRSEPRLSRGASIVLLAIVGAAVAMLAGLLIVYPSRRAGGSGRSVEVTIAPGESFSALADRLAAESVIESPRLFAVYARLVGADEHLRTGPVMLTDDMTPREVVQRIAVGFGSASVDVLVPEGFHRFDIASRLARWGVCSRDAFLEATLDPELLAELGIPGPSAEGYLFPDTYRFTERTDPRDVVRRMVQNHRRRTEPVLAELAAGLEELRRDLGWGAHEALILASIVEREAVARDEQPIIAGVFLNRLRHPTFSPRRLDADPTVAYGCLAHPDLAPSCANFRGRISRAMTHDPANPYNTYRRERLPPGPISNPGLAALRAVLAPARHDYLFFVASGGGRHTFSRTLSEHSRTIARVRGGASGESAE